MTLLTLFGLSLLFTGTLMTIAFFTGLLLKKPAIVDVFWGIGLAGLAWGGVLLLKLPLTGRTVIWLAVISLWALRLSLFLYTTRIRQAHVDTRYADLQKGWGDAKQIKTLGNYLFQALLQSCIAIGFFPILMSPTPVGYGTLVGAILAIGAIIGQGIADQQRYTFSQQFPGEICMVGLWRYSRHPNYFFEVLFWIGVALLSLGLPQQLLAWVSPIILWVIVRYITGPYTERLSLQNRGPAYQAYQDTVFSMIIPRLCKPKKRRSK